MVFWALCRQDCGPKLGSGYYFFGQRSDVELIFLNLLCQLYAADRHSRGLELLESEHRPDSPDNRGSGAAKPWELDRSSSGGWFERSETLEYLGQLIPTFLEKLFPEMI
jgi:hypothetical protein